MSSKNLKNILLSSFLISTVSGCNSGGGSINTNNSKSDASGVIRLENNTLKAQNEDNLFYSVVAAGSQSPISVLTTNGSLLQSESNAFRYTSNDKIPKDITHLRSNYDKIIMSGQSGNIYYTTYNFSQIIDDNVKKNLVLYGATIGNTNMYAVGYNGNVFIKSSFNPESPSLGTWKNIPLNGSTLYSIASDGWLESNIVTVGNSGTIWVSHDSGIHWKKVVVPNVTSNLYEVENINGSFYAVGDFATLLHSNNNGDTWEKYTFADPAINAKHFKSINSVIYDSKTGQRKIIAVGSGGALVSSIDKGLNWTIGNSGVSSNLSEAACANYGTGDVCYAVGANNILQSNDKGLSWNKVNTLPALPSAVKFSINSTTVTETAVARCETPGEDIQLMLTNISKQTKPASLNVTYSGDLRQNLPITCNLSESSPVCNLEIVFKTANCTGGTISVKDSLGNYLDIKPLSVTGIK